MENINILITDDQETIRNGIKRGWSRVNSSWKFYEAANGLQAIEILKTQPVDLIILDIGMLEMDGITTLQHIREINQQVKVIMFSMLHNEDYTTALLELNANGFLSKIVPLAEVRKAIYIVLNGGFYACEGVQNLIDRGLPLPKPLPGISDANLTPREIDVLQLILKSNVEISKKLVIAESTVEKMVAALIKKTQADSRGELFLFAQRCGLLS